MRFRKARGCFLLARTVNIFKNCHHLSCWDHWYYHVIWTWDDSHMETVKEDSCVSLHVTSNFWTLHVVSPCRLYFSSCVSSKIFRPWQDWALTHPEIAGSVGLKCREELWGAGLRNRQPYGSFLRSVLLFSTPASPSPFPDPSDIVPMSHMHIPQSYPPISPSLFTIMRCWWAWWQIGYEAVLSKWPTISFERSQFSESFFPACSTFISPEVSVNIPKCVCQQER